MPRLTCWFIRAALGHLALGALFGALILSAKAFPLTAGWAWSLLPAHIQIMLGGWMIQLALGMAYWILPRTAAAGDRGRSVWAWASFAALNAAGTALVFRPVAPSAWLDGTLVVAALLQAGALLCFAAHAWPRLAPLNVQPLP